LPTSAKRKSPWRVRTNYSGGPYSGEVVVLIIADLIDVREPQD
jgi:hypothetical protein